MTGLPTTQVLLDNGTGSFPYDITAYCLLEDGFSFTHGRDDWQGGVTAGVLNLSLNNADGRFSPGSTIIASPSPIKVDQRIRVKETVNGTTFTRFTGYVKSWPVSWPAVVGTISTVRVTASDAQARAERRVLRSVIEEEILADSPSAYYTLGEPAGAATAADTSGNQAPALTSTGTGTAVVFGTATGPGTDGLTAATFAGGLTSEYLSTTLPAAINTVECFFLRNGIPGGNSEAILNVTDGTTSLSLAMQAGAGTLIITRSLAGGAIQEAVAGSPNVADNAFHHLEWQVTTGAVYLDGVLLDSSNTYTLTGAQTFSIGGGTTNTDKILGVIAHAASWASLPSAGRIAAHATAGLTGFAGEAGTTRLTRTAGYANLPTGTFDTSLTNVPFVDIGDGNTTAWSAIQQVADAEGGVVFFDGSGNLIFHNRNKVVAKLTPDLTVVASSYVTADVEPTQDDQQILNYIEASAQSTLVPQVARNTTSETSHGRYSDSKTYLVATDAEAIDRASWIVANFAEPTTRFGTLTFNLYAMPPATAAAVLTAIEIDAWVRITGNPTQMPGGTTVDVIVEGYTETQNGGLWQLSCNVVSQSLFLGFILDSATRGVLDTNQLYV